MAGWPIETDTLKDANKVIVQFQNRFKEVRTQAVNCRTMINDTNEVNTRRMFDLYSLVNATRRLADDNINTPGLQAAFDERFPALTGTVDIVSEYTVTVGPAMVAFETWISTHTAINNGSGRPDVYQYDVNGALEVRVFTLGAAAKQDVLDEVDALIAVFSIA